MENTSKKLTIGKDAIAVRIGETLQAHIDYRKEEGKALCIERCSKEIVKELGNIYNTMADSERAEEGFTVVVQQQEKRFACSQGTTFAGYIPFTQIGDLVISRLSALPEGHNMGKMDLNMMMPSGLEVTAEELAHGASEQKAIS